MPLQPRAQLLRQLLDLHYAPHGSRLGIVVADDCPAHDAAVVAAALVAHGQAPERRLAWLRPRPGTSAPSIDEVADFLRRYGHEYGVAWLPATAPPAALETIAAAARSAGCAIGWDLTAAVEPPVDGGAVDASAPALGADFALWTAPGDPADTARAWVRPPGERLTASARHR